MAHPNPWPLNPFISTRNDSASPLTSSLPSPLQVALSSAQRDCQAVQDQARAWGRELEGRPEQLDGYAVSRTRFLEMHAAQEQLFKVWGEGEKERGGRRGGMQ